MKLYRVLPYDSSAAPTEKGGVLFRTGSALGRIANLDIYTELYLAREPEAAIAETFGRFPVWNPSTFIHAAGRPQSLVSYELDDTAPIFDLNDIDALRSLGISKPSDIVTRDRKTTRAWSRTIFEMHAHHGASWWSYYYGDWTIYGLWDIAKLSPRSDPELLTIDHPAVISSAAIITRQIVGSAPPRSIRRARG